MEVQYFVDIMSTTWAPAVVAHSYCVLGLNLQVIIVQTVRKRRSRHWTGKHRRPVSHKTHLSVTRRQPGTLVALCFCFCKLKSHVNIRISVSYRILTANGRFVVTCCDDVINCKNTREVDCSDSHVITLGRRLPVSSRLRSALIWMCPTYDT